MHAPHKDGGCGGVAYIVTWHGEPSGLSGHSWSPDVTVQDHWSRRPHSPQTWNCGSLNQAAAIDCSNASSNPDPLYNGHSRQYNSRRGATGHPILCQAYRSRPAPVYSIPVAGSGRPTILRPAMQWLVRAPSIHRLHMHTCQC